MTWRYQISLSHLWFMYLILLYLYVCVFLILYYWEFSLICFVLSSVLQHNLAAHWYPIWTYNFSFFITKNQHYRSSNALFELTWLEDGAVAFRANNGKYVGAKRSGHLYANCDVPDENSKYYFYLINRYELVIIIVIFTAVDKNKFYINYGKVIISNSQSLIDCN